MLALTTTYPRWTGDTEPAFVQNLAQGLAAAGCEVRVLTPSCPGALGYEREGAVEVCRYRYWLAGRETLTGAGGIVSRLRRHPLSGLLVPPLLLATLLAAWRHAASQRATVVHAHWLIPQGVLAIVAAKLSGRRPRVLATAHGGDVFALRGRLFDRVRRWVVAHADHVTAVSRYVREELIRQGADGSRISVASMGVDLRDRFRPAAGVARDPGRVIFVGRLVEKKGVAVLVEAMDRLRASRADAHLIVVGDGPERSMLERLVAERGLAGGVSFLGARPQAELPALYSSAAVAVVPSIVDALGDQEGLGLVSIEAMGCGCAVVASDLPAIRDAVSDGVNGLLVPPRDPDALATAIAALLGDGGLRERVSGEHVRLALVERFDWQNVARHYAAVIRELDGGTGQA
ncbi:MAG: glycosyltransferase [Gammaproteobacteria bacterium]|nr:glycosyltransferase [Gammaproteobacteria bacterium]MBI5618176.1 glycosyltransferase [Gammaproteobacteria bacterium]